MSAGYTQTTIDCIWWWEANTKFPICLWFGR